jgi:hypothetical protein
VLVWIYRKRAARSWTPARLRRTERVYSAQARSIFASVLVARAHWEGSAHGCASGDELSAVLQTAEDCIQSALLDTAFLFVIKRLFS